MAVLDIDEIGARPPRHARRANIILDQSTQLVVREDLPIVSHPKPGSRIGCRYATRGSLLAWECGLQKRPEWVSLEANDHVGAGAELLLVGVAEDLAKLQQVGFGMVGNQESIGIGAAVGPNGHRFTAANKLGPAQAEPLPAPAYRSVICPSVVPSDPSMG